MDGLSSFELFKIRLTGVLFALAYYTSHRNFLGVGISAWLKWGLLIFTLAAWIGRWPVFWLVFGVVLFIGVQFFYWYARRQGYIRFLPVEDQWRHAGEDRLADNKKVKTLATGTFSVSNHEAYVLLKPAEYWRVPVGDHAIMVQHRPGKFLYQFVQSGALQSVELGYLIFGRRPKETLAINFLTTWGPEFGQNTPKQFAPSGNHTPAKLERTIYLTFSDAEDQRRVRKNLMRDAGKPLHKAI